MRAGQIQLGAGGWLGRARAGGRGGGEQACGGTETRQRRRLHHLPPQPSPSIFYSSPWVSFCICVFGFFALYFLSLCPQSHISTRWPVSIKIKPLEASSWQTIQGLLLHLGSLICVMCKDLPGTLQECTTETRLKRLENRSHVVYYPPNLTKRVR